METEIGHPKGFSAGKSGSPNRKGSRDISLDLLCCLVSLFYSLFSSILLPLNSSLLRLLLLPGRTTPQNAGQLYLRLY